MYITIKTIKQYMQSKHFRHPLGNYVMYITNMQLKMWATLVLFCLNMDEFK